MADFSESVMKKSVQRSCWMTDDDVISGLQYNLIIWETYIPDKKLHWDAIRKSWSLFQNPSKKTWSELPKSPGRGDDICLSIVLSRRHCPQRPEPRGLTRDDGERPDGVASMPWKNGRCLIWDVTCPDTLAASYLDNAVTHPGVMATEAETRNVINIRRLMTQRTISNQLRSKRWPIEMFNDLGHRMQVRARDLYRIFVCSVWA